jgi:hypothetical protein
VAMSRDWNDLPRVVVGRRADAATPDQ